MNLLADNDRCTSSCTSLISANRIANSQYQRKDFRSICLKPRKSYPLPLPKSVPHLTKTFFNEHLLVSHIFTNYFSDSESESVTRSITSKSAINVKRVASTFVNVPLQQKVIRKKRTQSLKISAKHVKKTKSNCPGGNIENKLKCKLQLNKINQKNTKNNELIKNSNDTYNKKINKFNRNKNLTVKTKYSKVCSNIDPNESYTSFKLNNGKSRTKYTIYKFPTNKTRPERKNIDNFYKHSETTPKNKELFKDTSFAYNIIRNNFKTYQTIRNFWKQKTEKNSNLCVTGSKITDNLNSSGSVIFSIDCRRKLERSVNQSDTKQTEDKVNFYETSKKIFSKKIESISNKKKRGIHTVVFGLFNTYVFNKLGGLVTSKEISTTGCVSNTTDINDMFRCSTPQKCDLQVAYASVEQRSTNQPETSEKMEKDKSEPSKSNRQCYCSCTCKGQDGKCKCGICHYSTISESLFLGPTLDEIVVAIFAFFRYLGTKLGFIKEEDTSKKAKSCMGCNFYNKTFDDNFHDVSKNQIDVVKWLHDEYLRLAQDVAEANAALEHNCPCTKDNCPIVLQSRRFVLDRLAELLEKKQELEITYSKKKSVES